MDFVIREKKRQDTQQIYRENHFGKHKQEEILDEQGNVTTLPLAGWGILAPARVGSLSNYEASSSTFSFASHGSSPPAQNLRGIFTWIMHR